MKTSIILTFATLLLASCAAPRDVLLTCKNDPVFRASNVKTCEFYGYEYTKQDTDKQERMSLAEYRDSAGVQAACAHYKRASYSLEGAEKLGALDDYENCINRKAEEKLKAERRDRQRNR